MSARAPLLAAALAWAALAGCDGAAPKIDSLGDAARGRVLMTRFQCGSCHVIPAVSGAAGRTAPPLADMAQRSYIAGQLPNTPAHLVRWLMDPPGTVPGARMPAMGLTEIDARDIAAALLALK